ncbi:MAG: CRISPR system precrRNA processing endoribonuclease RAMP protein Cas6, partial [Pseudoleptotrichia goodfellowii]|nr:CRISPR system precrRNA processing endoribonuclease RAMP protein Cas6 [Pseudoleptotrichia goodfellowii]
LKIKIVTPVLSDNEKFIFGFENVFQKIIKDFEEYVNDDLSEVVKESSQIFTVINEKYYLKEIKFNSIMKKSYLGEIDIVIDKKEYKNFIYSIFQFAKFNGIGKYSEYGFGQIILK